MPKIVFRISLSFINNPSNFTDNITVNCRKHTHDCIIPHRLLWNVRWNSAWWFICFLSYNHRPSLSLITSPCYAPLANCLSIKESCVPIPTEYSIPLWFWNHNNSFRPKTHFYCFSNVDSTIISLFELCRSRAFWMPLRRRKSLLFCPKKVP